MNKVFLMMSVSLVLLFNACNSGDTKSAGDIQSEMNEQLDEVLGDAGKWEGKLDQLFTLEMAAQATGYAAAEATKDYNQVLKNPQTHSIQYKWDKGRIEVSDKVKNRITGKPMEIPADDYVEVSWVRGTTLKDFKHNYHTPTAEEMAYADKAVSAKTAEMQSQGKINAEQAAMANDLAADLAKGLSYDEVPGVGDYAVWNNKDKNLKVFYQGLEFQVYANLGDGDRNKNTCVDIAKKIISEKL